jgi:hypothetical protein
MPNYPSFISPERQRQLQNRQPKDNDFGQPMSGDDYFSRMQQQQRGSSTPPYRPSNQFNQHVPSTAPNRPSGQYGRGSRNTLPTGGVHSGDFVAEAHMADYENQARAREQQRQTLEAYMQNLRGVDALGQQGMQQAQMAGQQGMQIGRQGLEALINQGKDATNVYRQTRGDVGKTMALAKGEMQKGVDTMMGAIGDHDFFRKDTVSGGVNAIQSQFQSAREQINSNPNLSPEDKQAELRNLDNTMRQQTSMYASQADSQAAESMLGAKNALSQMQANMGATLGGLGMQGAGLSSSAGMQAAGMNQQALQAGYNLMASQNQFMASLGQSATAQAIQARLNGNMVGAQLAEMRPLGAPNMVDTILGAQLAQGMRPGDRATGEFAGRMGQMMGMGNFRGFTDQRQASRTRPAGRPFGGSFSSGAGSQFRGIA